MVDDAEPIELNEPEDNPQGDDPVQPPRNIWMRGLWVVVFALLLRVAGVVLCAVAVIQFFWMLIKQEKHSGLVDFGERLAKWAAEVVRFQTAATEDKPFPWDKWPA